MILNNNKAQFVSAEISQALGLHWPEMITAKAGAEQERESVCVCGNLPPEKLKNDGQRSQSWTGVVSLGRNDVEWLNKHCVCVFTSSGNKSNAMAGRKRKKRK